MQEADHILIPLLNGSYALAQIARRDAHHALLHVTRTQTSLGTKTKPLIDRQIVAVLCVDLRVLSDGHWPVIGYEPIPRLPLHRETPFSDLDAHDPAIVEAFASALHGLYPWDGFPDPDFFTKLLRPEQSIPFKARMTADLPKPDETT